MISFTFSSIVEARPPPSGLNVLKTLLHIRSPKISSTVFGQGRFKKPLCYLGHILNFSVLIILSETCFVRFMDLFAWGPFFSLSLFKVK